MRLSSRIALMFLVLIVTIVLAGLINIWSWGGDSARFVEHDIENKSRVALAMVRGDMDRFMGVVPTVKGHQFDFVRLYEYDNYESVGIMLRDIAEIAQVDLLMFVTNGKLAATNDEAAVDNATFTRHFAALLPAIGERASIVQLSSAAISAARRPAAASVLAYATKVNITDISGGTVATVMAIKFVSGRNDLVGALAEATDAHIALFDADSKLILSSSSETGAAPPFATTPRLDWNGQSYFARRVALPAQMGNANHANSANHANTSGWLELLVDTRPYDKQYNKLLFTVAFSAIGLALAGVLLFGFLRNQVLNPVSQLLLALRAVTEGDLTTRLAIRDDIAQENRDEIQRMLVDFNHMMDRLQGSYLELNQANQAVQLANQELEAVNARLRDLDQLKSDFLSSVSHELRTPLTSIRGFASLINRDFSKNFIPILGQHPALEKKTQRITENLTIILKETDRLTRLINDVLDLAKIEAGRITWNDAEIEPQVLVHDAINAVQGMFPSNGDVVLTCHIEPDLPPLIGDIDRLEQVLVNLLNNAAKFTVQGEVGLWASLDADRQLRLEVRDSGTGFPPADAEKIFDKFQQSSQGDTLTDRPKGTGLGLAIAREIVERHGGRIRATSVPGEGSVFTILLPTNQTQ